MRDRTRSRLVQAAAAAFVVVAICTSAPAAEPADANWPQFRGASNAGLAGAGIEFPPAFTGTDIRWKITLGGTGYGSPAVWGDRAFVLTCDEQTGIRQVVCVSMDNGKALWRKAYRLGVVKHHRDSSLAASTPAVDATRVIVCWASPREVTVYGLDHAGKEIWKRDLGPHKTQHGPCVTPILYNHTVYVANDNQGPSVLMAIDTENGEIKWQRERPSGKAAYGTPLIYRPTDGARPQLVLSSTAAGLAGYDLETGARPWIVPNANPQRVVASPVQVGDLIVSTSGTGGRGKWILAVRPPAKSGGEAKTAWQIDKDAPYVPTTLAVNGLLFSVHDSGTVACYRSTTGELVWKNALPGRFYGSPVCAAGRIYVISKDGTLFCFAAAETFKLLGKTDLGDKSFATPAIAGSRMLLRTHRTLICVEGKKAGSGK